MRLRDGHHPLAGSQCELLDQPSGDRGVVERQPGLRHQRRACERSENDHKSFHAVIMVPRAGARLKPSAFSLASFGGQVALRVHT